MSYLVLARKYRPKYFSEMVGQEHVVRALSNALKSQRLHHAYLFTGTRGVGKTTVSRILAKSLNCLGPDGQGGITDTPCGVCQSCRDIDAGCFVDYTELDAASNRGVDEVQSLLEQAVYKPVQGRFKVFMIDEVHMLSNTAFNAMLKTLEEPPEYLKFVLATTDPQKVPVTVLSRCLQFNLRPMAPETIREHLGKVLGEEHIQADPAALRSLARAARGSMRDALSLTDQAIAFGSGVLEATSVNQMLGSVDQAHVFKLLGALVQGDAAAVVSSVDDLRQQGLSAHSTLEELAVFLQRMAVLQMVPAQLASTLEEGSGSVDLYSDGRNTDGHSLGNLAAQVAPDATQLLYSMCLHGRAELGLAPDEYAALTMVLLRFFAFAPAQKKTLKTKQPEPPRALSTAPDGASFAQPLVPSAAAARVQLLPVVERPRDLPLQAKPDSVRPENLQAVSIKVAADTPRLDRVSAPEPAKGAVSELQTTEDGDFWYQIVQELVKAEAVVALVRELALQSQLIARDAGHWMLRLERESLNSPNSRQRLSAALEAVGHKVALSFEVGRVTDSPAKRIALAAAQKQQAAEKVIYEDPWVQEMMRDFGAKIVPGSIQPL
ncbi:MAG: DNA polymerase III subunit gamma/tau [Betaproteobacteria bacterium]|nr:DNA polymerase III subunit gamma/tau [Betaproteobacteria bacterium]